MPKVTAAYLDARRRGILEAAIELFAEKGFVQTSVRDVAAASGLSTGAVYRYFPSKYDLVLAAGSEGEDMPIPCDAPARAAEHLRDRMDPRHEGRLYARLAAQIWGNAAIDGVLAAAVTRNHTRARDQLANLIARHGSAQGGCATPADEAEVVLAALIGYAALVAADAPVDHDGFGRALSHLLD